MIKEQLKYGTLSVIYVMDSPENIQKIDIFEQLTISFPKGITFNSVFLTEDFKISFP